MLLSHSVDLIVVGANSLEARELKQTLNSIAEECRSKPSFNDDDDPRSSKKSINADMGARKEAFVIWGSTEVPKLFSMSHNS